MTLASHAPLLGIADEVLAERLSREIEHTARPTRPVVVTDLFHLCDLTSRTGPAAIVLDSELVGREPLDGLLRQLTASAPVILIAPLERQFEVGRRIASGDVEFVARTGDFVPLAACLVERRLRWAEMSASMLALPWGEADADLGTIFRHEINNPLTGILGNAELVLAHRDHLSAVDTQRLQTVVDLAVRLRETVRRLSNAWEHQQTSAKSA
ncbi:MAG TPA: histidine kinase dimerization/phospho-acceptor domain-containing protein [Candidatus Acidoferrum sp.]|nr:histidine kinase dimerization/phospho-acceptor domain-containing protein [Candidatus Acidoferrum sp.]